MFDLGWQELLLVAVVTLLVVGPKDLPKLFNKAGKLIGNIKQISREFFDKVSEAGDIEEIKNLKSSINDITDFDSYEDDNLINKIGSKTTAKKKRKTPKISKKLTEDKPKTS